jgi:hypothetical protein
MTLPTVLAFAMLASQGSLGSRTSAQESSPTESLPERVRALAAQLDADREQQREEAETSLLGMGPEVLKHFPPISKDSSPEWRMRVDRLLERWVADERQRLEHSPRISLEGSKTVREFLEEIDQQTSNPPLRWPEEALGLTVDLHLESATYWEAIDELLDASKAALAAEDGERLQVIAKHPESPQRSVMAAYSESLRLEPIAMEKKLSMSRPQDSGLDIQLSIAWEPRLNPIRLQFDLEQLQLRCDNSEVLRPKKGQGPHFLLSGSQLIALLEFDRPTRTAQEIVDWQGTVELLLPGPVVGLEFDALDTAKNQSLSIGQLQVTLERTRKNRDVQEVLVGIQLEGQQDSNLVSAWTSLMDAHMVAADGEAIEHAGWSTHRMTASELGISFLFELEKEIDQYRFVFRAPQSVVRQVHAYSFPHVPLP